MRLRRLLCSQWGWKFETATRVKSRAVLLSSTPPSPPTPPSSQHPINRTFSLTTLLIRCTNNIFHLLIMRESLPGITPPLLLVLLTSSSSLCDVTQLCCLLNMRLLIFNTFILLIVTFSFVLSFFLPASCLWGLLDPPPCSAGRCSKPSGHSSPARAAMLLWAAVTLWRALQTCKPSEPKGERELGRGGLDPPAYPDELVCDELISYQSK